MPGQINKALAKPSGQLSIRFFFPRERGKDRGGVERRRGIEKEKERKGERPHSLAFHSHGLNADN